MPKLSRRHFLQASLSAAAVAHGIVQFWSNPSRAATDNRKTVFFFHPNGRARNGWSPTGGENDFRLGATMKAFDTLGVKEHMCIVEGADYVGSVSSHETGAAIALRGNGGIDSSFDVALGEAVGKDFNYPYLALGAYANFEAGEGLVSQSKGTPLHHIDEPLKAYAQIFGVDLSGSAGNGGAGVSAELSAMRRNRVMDIARGELSSVRSRLGMLDREKLDNHVDSLERVQNRLQRILNPEPEVPAQPGVGANRCQDPAIKDRVVLFPDIPSQYPDPFNDVKNLDEVSDIMMDLTVLALECGVTPVVSFSLHHHTAGADYAAVGAPGRHHGVSHSDGPVYERMKEWDITQMAKFVKKLSERPDAEGTSMIDNTLVYSFSEIAVGQQHNGNDVSIIMAGGGVNGGNRGGRYLKYSNLDHTRIFVSMAKWMGWNTNSFNGGSGPAPDLLAI